MTDVFKIEEIVSTIKRAQRVADNTGQARAVVIRGGVLVVASARHVSDALEVCRPSVRQLESGHA